MKRTILLLSFCCSLPAAVAQRKAAFGLVVKSGIYTVEFQDKSTSSYNGSLNTTLTQKPGNAFIFGVRQSFRLGSHFCISGDLLYRYISYATVEQRIATNSHYYNAITGQKVSENSVSVDHGRDSASSE